MARLSVLVGFLALLALSSCCQAVVRLELLGQSAGLPGGGTEQVAFDDKAKVAYLIGDKTLYVVDLSPEALLSNGTSASPPRSLPLLQTLVLPTTLTDVAFCGDYLALSAEGPTKVLNGTVTIYSRYTKVASSGQPSLQPLVNFTVGALPDQLEFSKDCSTILVSNEGEPSSYQAPSLQTDPEGSVSIIKLRFCQSKAAGIKAAEVAQGVLVAAEDEADSTQYEQDNKAEFGRRLQHYGCGGRPVSGFVRTATFSAWNDKRDQLLAAGIKINGPGASVAQDLEPEYTTFSQDEKTAFVSLQENNAMATLDVASATITAIYPLGFKNHSSPLNPLDPSDNDGGIKLAPWPVFGMYQPDEIRSYRYRGVDYVVTANEGDARDWPSFKEEARVKDIKNQLSTTAFPDVNLSKDAQLGRLNTLTNNSKPFGPFSDPAGTGFFQNLYAFGARSFSIWRLESNSRRVRSLKLVFDSAAQLEQISRDQLPQIFNSEGRPDSFDKRSDNKGPEPEGLAIGPCPNARNETKWGAEDDDDCRRCLFLGTERLGVIFVYDISNPLQPVFQSLAAAPQPDAANAATRFTGPEGITFARYTLSKRPSMPIVLVAYEGDVSGLGVYRVVNA